MQEHFDGNGDLEQGESITRVTGMYKDWFLDYASYVILERAVPSVEDGFKPVQRRIMQSMKTLMMVATIKLQILLGIQCNIIHMVMLV